MPEVDLKERPWRLHVLDMIEYSEKVLAYTEGMDRQAFIADGLIYDAALRNLQLMGEAAKRIPDEVRQAHSEIPWHALIGTPVHLTHSYLTICDSIVWCVIQENVPDLLPALRNLLKSAAANRE
ncbi:MAG: DUF86 domain-containing protein [Caldilineaceae bacterium]|nr:DUF86 domain-containing protein [Caldilineaceae bacterium]